MSTQRINISFPDDLAEQLKALVPEGERSRVVSEATRKELERLQRKGAYERLLALRKTAKRLGRGEVVETLRIIRRSSS